MTDRTWLITGCSSGFGRELAEAVLARGERVLLTARDPSVVAEIVERYEATACAMSLNVRDPREARAAVAEAEARFGGLDVLVNNAGYGFIGAVEEAEPAEYRPMFETNLFGLIETTRAALPALRRRRGGRIVNFSSVGGITSRAGFGLYGASKFAVEGLSEALAEEVRPFGIAVIIVEPGSFRTQFLGRSIAVAQNRISAYDETSGRIRHFRESTDGKQSGDPSRAVTILLEAVNSPSPPLRLPIGPDAYARIRAKLERLNGEM